MAWQTFKDLMGYENTSQPMKVGELLDAAGNGQNGVTMIGTKGAGKSAHLAGLLVAADRKVSKSRGTEYPFTYVIDEGSGNIEHDKSALRAGHFPPKTGALKMSTVEPAATFQYAHVKYLPGGKPFYLSKRQAKMVIADLAGEDLINLIERVNSARTLQDAARIPADRAINLVCQSRAILLIIKATRAQGLDIELEKEPTDVNGMSIYSDANLKRMVNGIVKFKKQNSNFPSLTHVGVVVTAWDGLAPVAEQISRITGQPFNPLDTKISAESLDKFVQAFYPSTHAAITSLGLNNIRYFPSFFELEYANGKPVSWDTSNPNDFKIKRKDIFDRSSNWEDNVNAVHYSEYWFFKELEWLQELASE
jgi:hypothetical protein